MAEYVDREALRNKWCNGCCYRDGGGCLQIDPCEHLFNAFLCAPATDVVEVVRCKDCKYSRPLNRKDMFEDTFVEGCVWCMLRSGGVFEDDFCSDGGRRDNNAES